MSASAHHRVHFPDAASIEPADPEHTRPLPLRHDDVSWSRVLNFGLVKVRGIYSSTIECGDPKPDSVHIIDSCKNPNMTLSATPEGISVRFHAVDVGSINEKYFLDINWNSLKKQVELQVHGRVMAEHKGTPMLRPWIHFHGSSNDEDTEALASDN